MYHGGKIAMSKHEELLEQQNKWKGLIHQTEQTHKKMLALMVALREELDTLSQLKKEFPHSVTIGQRIDKCHQLLEQSSEILDDIKKQLSEFKKQKEGLDWFINQQREASRLHPSTANFRHT